MINRLAKACTDVLSPPLIDCYNKRPAHIFSLSNAHASKQTVTKLFALPNDYDNEAKIYGRIAKIDPDNKYFVTPIKGCYARYKNISKHPATKGCQMLKQYKPMRTNLLPPALRLNHQFNNDDKLIPQITLPFAGIDLINYIHQRGEIVLKDWLKLLKNLIEGIAVLRDHKICHLDIKLDNIMCLILVLFD